ncbi:hypothetical protein BDF14DRAFT_1874785 [Spinellus fusiger]|nr:hypothetical protein BDF14DRAFT_1874785 [Spinellus fusiger]
MQDKSSTLPYTKGLYSPSTLLSLYSVDIAAAAVSSAVVSPFIAVVDRSIIENANGKHSLSSGLKTGLRHIFTQPHTFIPTPQFGYVFTTYFTTYITANVIDTTCENHSVDFHKTALMKFLGTSIVNMSLSIIKDRAFTRMFGVSAARPLPTLSYLLFAARDSLTIAASFTAPSYIAAALERMQWVSGPDQGRVAAQLVCPASVQFFSTPLHLLALDLYNRPLASSLQRLKHVRMEYLKSTLARIGRIGPAFGLGGIGNSHVRSYRTRVMGVA